VTSTLGNDRLVNIQLLRFVAAGMVVFHHARNQADYFGGTHWFKGLTRGHVGVDIFFVISGFIMVYIVHKRAMTPSEFFLKRLFRVWPIYAVVTIIAAILVFYAPRYYHSDPDLLYVIKSLLFIPVERSDGHMYPVLVQGWTLNLEIAFYSIFALALFTARPALVSVVGLVAFYAIARNVSWLSFYSAGGAVILEFALGVGLAVAYLRGFRLPTWLAVVSLVAGTVLIFTLHGHERLFVYGLPALLIVAGALWLPSAHDTRMRQALDFLGCISYPMYLVHNVPIQSGTRILNKVGFAGGSIDGEVFLIGVLLATIAIAAAMHVGIERPVERTRPTIERWLRRSGSDQSGSDTEMPSAKIAA
jgi:exopolysaccharide production protein ExoZ